MSNQSEIDEVFYACERAEMDVKRRADYDAAFRQLIEAIRLLAKQMRHDPVPEDEMDEPNDATGHSVY